MGQLTYAAEAATRQSTQEQQQLCFKQPCTDGTCLHSNAHLAHGQHQHTCSCGCAAVHLQAAAIVLLAHHGYPTRTLHTLSAWASLLAAGGCVAAHLRGGDGRAALKRQGHTAAAPGLCTHAPCTQLSLRSSVSGLAGCL
eukprot:1140012-Pelagomonas_calceolata.AAC.7